MSSRAVVPSTDAWDDEDDDFTSNGLLGGSHEFPESSPAPNDAPAILDGNTSISDTLGKPAQSTTGNSYSTLSTFTDDDFVSTGLLGGDELPAQRDVIELAELSQSQEDEFPSLSELLGNKPLTETTPTPAISNSLLATSLSTSIRGKTYDGRRVYFRRKPKTTARKAIERAQQHNASNLLDVPIHRLMEELSVGVAQKICRDEASAATATASSSSSRVDEPEEDLWVDRYKPRRYMDLLGDERVHRDTLSWVKEWDFCVFGKRRAKGKATKRAWDNDTQEEGGEWKKDEFKRPREKLLLLSGPPGLGKTTLAHIVARQAGYSVFEINASDARSASIVDDRIRPALESGSMVGSSKPSLFVIDEIDGATGGGENSSGFIQKLVELTYDRPKKSRKRNDGPATQRPLLRPIICICNDLYAASLAKLRPHARIIRFNRPADIHIVKRLRAICEAEALRADSRALSTLVGVAKGDLRGCLNTLQFIKARNQEVTEAVVRGATAGMKEVDTSFSTVINNLFSPITRKRAKELGLTEVEESRYVNRLSREVEATGALDKIALGCFEHYTNLRRHDANFARYEKAEEWLSTYDMLNGAVRGDRDYGLMPYLSYTLVPFFPLFQERGNERVERPKADWENYMITRTNEEIYKSLGRCLRSASGHRAGDYRHLASDQILQLEFAPMINRIISPPLRPVNSQVIKPEERALLSRLVSIMVSLELRFVQEKAEDGQLVYRLDPPLDVFVTYDSKRAADIAISRYATRHLVAGEIDAQLIVRHAEAIERHQTSRPEFFGKSADDNHHEADEIDPDAPTGEGTLLSSASAMSEARAAKRPKADVKVDIADKPPTDFFGRPIMAAPVGAKSKKGSSAALKKAERKLGVSYRFNEGNSAAVRKPVKVSTFL